MRTTLCPQHVEEGKKRKNIKRQGSRKIIGEEKFIPLLKEKGFQIFDDTPRSLEEQMDFFHGAEIIVCAHGAGQANMLWSNPRVRVLELRDAGLWHNCFRLWSHYNGARHELMVDWSRSDVTDWRLDCAYEDLKTNPAAFMRAVSTIL